MNMVFCKLIDLSKALYIVIMFNLIILKTIYQSIYENINFFKK